MGIHINKVCKSGFYYIHNLRKIRKYLSQDCLLTLIHAFVTTRLDCCNGLMYGLPQRQISKLQRLQNAAARLALALSKFCHISPALQQLYWLPVVKRIQFNKGFFIISLEQFRIQSSSYTNFPTILLPIFLSVFQHFPWSHITTVTDNLEGTFSHYECFLL